MESEIKIRNSAEICHIDIEGTIGIPEEWQFEEPAERIATYDKFRTAVQRIAAVKTPEVVVSIRSTGGDVNDALLIYDALRALPGRITTRCYGYTASAATLIAQAASKGGREISSGTLYLVHNSVCAAEGNAEELTAKTELLRKTDERIAEIYATRAERPVEEFTKLMFENNGNGRWLSPEETITAGLADKIIETGAANAAQKQSGTSLSQHVVHAWRKLLEYAKETAKNTQPSTATPIQDRNMLHFEEESSVWRQHSAVALREEQKRRGPTRTLPCEDPSCWERIRTANEEAYAEDARTFGKK